MGKQATSHARRFVAREGTTRRARDPPVRYQDKPLRPSPGATSLNPGVQFLMSKGVQFRTSVDKKRRRVREVVDQVDIPAMTQAYECTLGGNPSAASAFFSNCK